MRPPGSPQSRFLLRASVFFAAMLLAWWFVLLGPLLARRGSARLAPPGGDFPARRTISTHLEALLAMGAVPLDVPGHALEAPRGLKGASFYLDEASVTATLGAVLKYREDHERVRGSGVGELVDAAVLRGG